MTRWPIGMRAAVSVSGIVLVAWSSGALARTYTLYATSVPVVTDDWLNEARSEGAPESDCNNSANYATNDVGSSTDFMAATQFTALSLPSWEGIVKVEVDVNGRYDTSTSNDRFRVRVAGSVMSTALNSPTWSQGAADDACQWRMGGGGPGWDITSLRASWTAIDIAGLHVAVQRNDNTDAVAPKRARVNAFRIVVTTSECSTNPVHLDFDQIAIGNATDRMFQITNTGSGLIAGTLPAPSDPSFSILFPPSPHAYALGPGAVQDVWVRFAPLTGGLHSCVLPLGASGLSCPAVDLEGCSGYSFDLAFQALVTSVNDPDGALHSVYLPGDPLVGGLGHVVGLLDEDPVPNRGVYHSSQGYNHIEFGRSPDGRFVRNSGALAILVLNNDPARGDVVEITVTSPATIEGIQDFTVTSLKIVLTDPSSQALASEVWPPGLFNFAAWGSMQIVLTGTSSATGGAATMTATCTTASVSGGTCTLTDRGMIILSTDLAARITLVDDPFNLLRGAARVGAILRGTYGLKSSPADVNSDPAIGEYHWLTPQSYVSLTLDGLLIASDPRATNITVVASDRPPAAGADSYDLLTTINVPPYPGTQNDYTRWTVTNTQGTANQGTDAFQTPQLSRYESNILEIRGYSENNPGHTYRVLATVTAIGNLRTVTGFGPDPVSMAMGRGSPNPFFRETTLRLRRSDNGAREVYIYAVDGRRVRVLVAHEAGSAHVEATWDGRSDSGAPLAAGRYFYRFGSGTDMQTGSLVRLHSTPQR